MRIEIFGAALLVASLGLKLHGDYGVPFDDTTGALKGLSARLASEGYAVTLETGQRNRVTALRGSCRMVVRLIDPHGTNSANVARVLGREGQLGYLWRGEWRDGLPRFGPLMEYYFKRELVRQGIEAGRHPVWMAALGEGCKPRPDPVFSGSEIRLLRARQ